MVWKNVDKLRCPHCGSIRLRKMGPTPWGQRYQCKRCNGTTVKPKGGKART